LTLLVLAILAFGCTRSYYRTSADRETYGAIQERNQDPAWTLPRTSIDTPPESRLHDSSSPDFPPIPPDDSAAHRYMHCANGIPGYRKWHKDGDIPFIENPAWRESLSLDKDGILQLTPDKAVELGLLHSRGYQTALEGVYLNSLGLTFNRFDF